MYVLQISKTKNLFDNDILLLLDNLVMSGGGLQPLPQVLHGEANQEQAAGNVPDYQEPYQVEIYCL